MDINRAIEAAKTFCRKESYDEKKIDEMYKQTISGKLYVMRFPNTDTDGLTNDMGTQAAPVLVVNSDYTVAETGDASNILRQE